MAEPQAADDWFVPDQHSAAPSGEDWFVPPQTTTDKLARVHNALENTPLNRVEKAAGQGIVEGFGNEPLGIAPGSDTEKELQKTGLLHTPGAPFEPAQAIADVAVRGVAQAGDAFFRALGGASQGIAAGAGQVAREFGQNEADVRKLTSDVGTAEQLAVMSHIPEADMLAGAEIPSLTALSTPEEIAAFNRTARQAPGAPPPPPSKTRQEIDEFLRQRAAGEADQATPRLPPPDDWQVPPETAAPAPQPSAPSAPSAAQPLDTEYPSLEEPGRTAPAAPAEPQAVPGAGPKALQALLDDPRSAQQIRADLEAAKPPLPPAPAGEATAESGGQTPIQMGVNPQIPAQNGVVESPPTGAPDHPVRLESPADVFTGAEHTAEPTPAQAEAGNYRKRHVSWNGLDLAIETEAGMARTGTGPTGEPWSVTLTSPYGYIKGTKGADSEQVDAYLGPQPQSPHVYIVDQIDPKTGGFDEHKALIGYPNEGAAVDAYFSGFSDGSGPSRLGALQSLTVEGFKDWLSKGQRRNPVAYSDPVRAARSLANERGLNATDAEIEAAANEHKVNGTDLSDALDAVIEASYYQGEQQGVQSATEQGLGHEWTAAVDPAAENESSAAVAPPRVEPARPQSPPAPGIPPHGSEPGEAQPASQPEPVSGIPVGEPKYQRTKTGGYSVDESELPPFQDIGDGYAVRQYRESPLAGGNIRQEIRTPEGNVLIRGTQTDGKPYQEFEMGHNPFAAGGMDWVERAIAKLGERGKRPKIEAPAAPELERTTLSSGQLLKIADRLKAENNPAFRADAQQRVAELLQRMETEGRKIAEHCIATGGKFSVRN